MNHGMKAYALERSRAGGDWNWSRDYPTREEALTALYEDLHDLDYGERSGVYWDYRIIDNESFAVVEQV